MTLTEINDEFGAVRTNKKEFLEKMARIIPWGEFVAIVQPHICSVLLCQFSERSPRWRYNREIDCEKRERS